MTDVPHLALPLSLAPDGSLVTLEQDSVDDVAQCVKAVVSTTIGQRVDMPTFGIPQLAFGTVDASEIVDAVATWEPRAALDVEVIGPLDERNLLAVVEAAVRVQ